MAGFAHAARQCDPFGEIVNVIAAAMAPFNNGNLRRFDVKGREDCGQMIVLGINCGHDAAAVVLDGGTARSYVLRERMSRVKHAIGIDTGTIELALARARVSMEDIDCVALTSTQMIEIVIEDSNRMDLRYECADTFDRPFSLAGELAGKSHESIAERGSGILLDVLFDENLGSSFLGQTYRKMYPQYRGKTREQMMTVPWIDNYIQDDDWDMPIGLNDLGDVVPQLSDRMRYGFHVPITFTMDDISIPGYAIHHHLAHAASTFYISEYGSAAIMTHDGFGGMPGYHSGMFYVGAEEGLYPLWPHNLSAGYLYEHVANTLGLGFGGGSGKLMGLSGYGIPLEFDSKFIGNQHDHARHFRDAAKNWVVHCRRQALSAGCDPGQFGDPTCATAPINARIAATTQSLFEQSLLRAVCALKSQCDNAQLEASKLCLGGGAALNCPSNSQIAEEAGFRELFIDPACDDGGIAIGAALVVFHSILGNPRIQSVGVPYLGSAYGIREVEDAAIAKGSGISYNICRNPAKSAAEDLFQNKVVGWVEGGSECGPRALGHRSLLADPRDWANALRVNEIKGRETWRPFAPSVLADHVHEWFDRMPSPSPYMLFNARVTNGGIPAVTHIDGTARAQTVDESCGGFFELLKEWLRLTGTPVVLNTSLNGPGEPLVETPEEAIEMLIRTAIDVLYVDGVRMTRLNR